MPLEPPKPSHALSPADRDWIVLRAQDAGFALAGMAPAALPAEGERFAEWVESGFAGEMDYLHRRNENGDLLRGDLRRSMPWARSVVVCALNYDLDAPYSIEPAAVQSGWIARYAWSGATVEAMPGATNEAMPGAVAEGSGGDSPSSRGADYHDILLDRLRSVEVDLHTRFGTALQTRCYVDTGPLLERGIAAAAGIGWIGKNTCVLNQQEGSWLLLAVIVTSLEYQPDPLQAVLAPDRCGSCTRCIDACPTNALLATKDPTSARIMDAGRCIAYLTIEKKTSIAEELRAPMGRQVFGCDICQDVCPWNRRVAVHREPVEVHPLAPRRELINPSLAWLASLDGPAFNRWFRGSPLERTRRRRILRNVAIAMGNSGDTGFRPQLEAWAADTAADPLLAETAGWALGRIDTLTLEP